MNIITRKQAKKIDRLFFLYHAPDPLADPDDKWQKVITDTWNKYQGTDIGHVMQRRYFYGENPEQISNVIGIRVGTVFLWRNEFLTYAALAAVRQGLPIEFTQ